MQHTKKLVFTASDFRTCAYIKYIYIYVIWLPYPE